MTIFDYDASKIDPNLMKFFQSAEFSELIHKRSDIEVGEMGQHHNLGLTPTDAAPGGIVKNIKEDLDDLEEVVEDILDGTTPIPGASGGTETWGDGGNNLFRNPSFTSWDGSTGDLSHYPDGLFDGWGTFWSTGTRGVVSKEEVNTRDGTCLKWTPVDPAGSLQHIFSEPIRLQDDMSGAPQEVSVWLRVEDAAHPVTFSGSIYQAAHPNPAPFDGGTTVSNVFSAVSIDHTDWRQYTAIWDPTAMGLVFEYQAYFFSFSAADDLPRLHMDQAALRFDHLSTYQIPEYDAGVVDYPTAQIPMGWNNVGVGGSRRWRFIDGPYPADSLGVNPVLMGGMAADGVAPAWSVMFTNQIEDSNYIGLTLEEVLELYAGDTGWITSTSGFTAATNFQLDAVAYRVVGQVCHLRVSMTRITAVLTVPADGNYTNTTCLTAIASAVTPAFNQGIGQGNLGQLSSYYVTSSGTLQIIASSSGGNININDTLMASGTYLIG